MKYICFISMFFACPFLGHAGEILEKAEPLVVGNIEFHFKIEEFENYWFSNLEVRNLRDFSIKEFYKNLPKVALGIDGNQRIEGCEPNRLRIFSWGPIGRVQHSLGSVP